jgi:hypothetical protein
MQTIVWFPFGRGDQVVFDDLNSVLCPEWKLIREIETYREW